jgi:hemolysin D
MNTTPPSAQKSQPAEQPGTLATTTAKIIPLRPPSRWHDPLRLIQNEAPSEMGRIVLWTVSILIFILIIWAALGQLDIIASAEGKLTPQTLVKIVQPADSGVVKQLLVNEGDSVKAGQVLARLDTTLASADKVGVASDLSIQLLQVRRIEAELENRPMQSQADDDKQRYTQVHSEYIAHRQAYLDSVEQEKAQLAKAEHDRSGAAEVLSKLEQTVPTYKRAAAAYVQLEKEGFFGGLATADKQREAIEKIKDLDAQKSAVASLDATIAAEHKKINQIQSAYRNDLQKELADIRAKISQLQPNLDKSIYKEGLMELRAPQDGVIKDLATTTVGAVVQPGTVVLTLVPKEEKLYADVAIKNEDVGFVRVGQPAQIKLATYPFQQYGMLTGKVIHISADATESGKPNPASNAGSNANINESGDASVPSTIATYKVRIALDQQTLKDPQGNDLQITAGMQVVAEINQGQQSVLEYLLSPVKKAVREAGHER